MPKTRQQKQEDTKSVVDRLRRMKTVVFSSYAGLKVPEVTALRKTLRGQKIEYIVIKRTLLRRAMAQAGLEHIDLGQFTGSMAMAFSYDDEVLPAKLLDAFRKEHEAVQLLGGIVAGETFSAAQIQSLAKLPSRQELIAKILGSFVAPMRGLVTVASGPARGFVRVLQAVHDAK